MSHKRAGAKARRERVERAMERAAKIPQTKISKGLGPPKTYEQK